MNNCALTTFDNPFNPFENFDEWFAFDIQHGYNTCGKLMRIANIENDMSEVEYNNEIERAIDEIIQYDFVELYRKVYNTAAIEA
mgnify:CR=1 FL=1